MSETEKVTMCEGPQGMMRRGPVACGCLAIGLVLTGCSAEERASDPATPPVVATAAESPAAATPPESAERQAAEAAFRMMTTENVSPTEWEAANQRLQEIGQPALPVLVNGLGSDDQTKREMASTVLAWFGIEAESVATELIAALDDKSAFVQANVATALLQMPDQVDRVLPVLSKFLESEDADLRRMAATNLAAIETEKALPLLPQLIVALGDRDRDVVYYATQLVGRMGPAASAALPKLQAIDAGEDETLKSAVMTAILLIDPDRPAE